MENATVDRKNLKGLGAWVHPGTGERRIYVNEHGLFAKVWLTADPYHGGWQENYRANDGCHVHPGDVYFACLVAIEIAFGVDDGTTVDFEEMWNALAEEVK